MTEEEIADAFLEASKLCLIHALQMRLDLWAVEQMVQDAIKEVDGGELYCDIHK
jgi:hypothetical protein